MKPKRKTEVKGISEIEKIFEKLNSKDAKMSDFVEQYYESPNPVLDCFCKTYGMNVSEYSDKYLEHFKGSTDKFSHWKQMHKSNLKKRELDQINKIILQQALYETLEDLFGKVRDSRK